MVTASFTGFLLVLLLSSVAQRHSLADVRQAVQTGRMAKMDRTEKGSLEHQEGRTTAAVAAESRMLRGRKMGVEKEVKRDVRNEEGTKNEGANPSAGNCDHHGEGELDVECELHGRSLPSGINLVDFIPFSSDYRGAKTHPPKNN